MKAKKFLVSLLAGAMVISALSVSAFAKEQVEVSPEAAAMGIVAYELSDEETAELIRMRNQSTYSLNSTYAVNTISFTRTLMPIFSTSDMYDFDDGTFAGTAQFAGMGVRYMSKYIGNAKDNTSVVFESVDSYASDKMKFTLLGYNNSTSFQIMQIEMTGLPKGYIISNLSNYQGVTVSAINNSTDVQAASVSLRSYDS